jgi:hypothetical protein
VPRQPQEIRFRFSEHRMTSEDRIDKLAATYLGDPTLWWKIADCNPEILYWDCVAAGSIIRIPSVG